MEQIKDAISALLARLKEQQQGAAVVSPEELVRQVFSRKEQAHVAGRSMRNGVLAVTVESSTWLYYCTLHKQELLGKLRAIAPQIKDVRFRVGTI